MEMTTRRKIIAALAITGAMSLSATGIASAGSDHGVEPADKPGGAVSGSIERAPTPGYDEIVLGE
jgi:hypothetical protein